MPGERLEEVTPLDGLDSLKRGKWTSLDVVKVRNQRKNLEIHSARKGLKLYNPPKLTPRRPLISNNSSFPQGPRSARVSGRSGRRENATSVKLQAAKERVKERIEFLKNNPTELRKLKLKVREEGKKYQVAMPNIGEAGDGNEGAMVLRLNEPGGVIEAYKPNEYRRRLLIRSRQRKEHQILVQDRKQAIERQRVSTIRKKVNRREEEKLAKLLLKKKRKKVFVMGTFINLFSRMYSITVRLQELVVEEKERVVLGRNVNVIQRLWRQSKAIEYGRKYRRAIITMRYFLGKARKNLEYKRIRRRADMIHWVIVEIETSNFQKVVKRYRQRVCACQRYFRSYKQVTNQRLKTLQKVWDMVERNMIKREHKEEFQEKINVEIEATKDLFGTEETRKQLYQFSDLNSKQMELKKAGRKTRKQRNNFRAQVVERFVFLTNMPAVRNLAIKANSFADDDKIIIRKNKSEGMLPTAMRHASKELIFKLLFQNIHEFVFQAPVISPEKEKFKNKLLKDKDGKGAGGLKSRSLKSKRVPKRLKQQLLVGFLSESRRQMRLKYDQLQKEALKRRMKGATLTMADIKELLAAEDSNVLRQLLKKKYKISTKKQGSNGLANIEGMEEQRLILLLFTNAVKEKMIEDLVHTGRRMMEQGVGDMNSQGFMGAAKRPFETESLKDSLGSAITVNSFL